jgi:siderophore synthetase component
MAGRAIPVLLQVLMITHGVMLKTHGQNQIGRLEGKMVIREVL